jgi:hypothetical protein
MSWNNKKPVEEGYYWYLPSGNEIEGTGLEKSNAAIVKVVEKYILVLNSLQRFDIKDFDGLWNGPLPAPPIQTFTCLKCGWKGNEEEMYMIPVDDESQDAIMNERTCPKCRSVALEPL